MSPLRIFIVVILLLQTVLSYKVNITNISNCDFGNLIFPVEILNMSYIPNNSFVDTVHGYYIVRNNDSSDRDVIVKFYKCPERPEGPCLENVEEHVYSFTCEYYLKDIGPWSLLSEAMSDPHCTHPEGIYEFSHAKFDPIILEGYVDVDPKYNHYRLFLEFRSRRKLVQRAELKPEENHPIRACIDMEFDVQF